MEMSQAAVGGADHSAQPDRRAPTILSLNATVSAPSRSTSSSSTCPILGATTVWLYRRVGVLVLTADSTVVDLAELGRNLGVGGAGRNGRWSAHSANEVAPSLRWATVEISKNQRSAPQTVPAANGAGSDQEEPF
jgi:hypothetical protein